MQRAECLLHRIERDLSLTLLLFAKNIATNPLIRNFVEIVHVRVVYWSAAQRSD